MKEPLHISITDETGYGDIVCQFEGEYTAEDGVQTLCFRLTRFGIGGHLRRHVEESVEPQVEPQGAA